MLQSSNNANAFASTFAFFTTHNPLCPPQRRRTYAFHHSLHNRQASSEASEKIGNIQRRLAWPPRRDDMTNREWRRFFLWISESARRWQRCCCWRRAWVVLTVCHCTLPGRIMTRLLECAPQVCPRTAIHHHDKTFAAVGAQCACRSCAPQPCAAESARRWQRCCCCHGSTATRAGASAARRERASVAGAAL